MRGRERGSEGGKQGRREGGRVGDGGYMCKSMRTTNKAQHKSQVKICVHHALCSPA